MDSKAQKRIEVAKRKARAGESNEDMFVMCVCFFLFWGSNYKYFLFLI